MKGNCIFHSPFQFLNFNYCILIYWNLILKSVKIYNKGKWFSGFLECWMRQTLFLWVVEDSEDLCLRWKIALPHMNWGNWVKRRPAKNWLNIEWLCYAVRSFSFHPREKKSTRLSIFSKPLNNRWKTQRFRFQQLLLQETFQMCFNVYDFYIKNEMYMLGLLRHTKCLP